MARRESRRSRREEEAEEEPREERSSRRSKRGKSIMDEVRETKGGSFSVPGRLSYPNLFTPRPGDDPTGKPKYSLSCIVSKDVDLGPLEDAIEEVIEEKWKGRPPRGLRRPVRDGDEYSDKDGYDGDHVFFSARNTRRPYVVRGDRSPIQDEEDVYPGCYGLAIVEPFAYEKDTNKGVGLSLVGFVKVKDGERLGGGAPADPDDDLDDLKIDDEDLDFDEIDDDEIPF